MSHKKLLLKKLKQKSGTPSELPLESSVGSNSSDGTPTADKLLAKKRGLFSPGRSIASPSMHSPKLRDDDVKVEEATFSISMDGNLYSARSRAQDTDDDADSVSSTESVEPVEKKKYSYRQAALENVELYCYCRKPYDDKVFMIGCEQCDEWYHGDCVGISAAEAETIESYVCPECKKGTSKKRKRKEEEENTFELVEVTGSDDHHGRKDKKRKKEKKEKREKKEKERREREKREQRERERRRSEEMRQKQMAAATASSSSSSSSSSSLSASAASKKEGKEVSKNTGSSLSSSSATSSSSAAAAAAMRIATSKPSVRNVPVDTNMNLEELRQVQPQYVQFNYPDPLERGTALRATKVVVPTVESQQAGRKCADEDCSNPARRGSKYCSDYCGVKVNQEFLLHKLGKKVQEQWQQRSQELKQERESDLLNQKGAPGLYERVQELKSKHGKALEQLESTQELYKQVQTAIEVAETLQVGDQNDEGEAGEGSSGTGGNKQTKKRKDQQQLQCALCHSWVNVRTLADHMTKCVTRAEKSLDEYALTPVMVNNQVVPSVFCDTLDPRTRKYCRKMAATCPYHHKKGSLRSNHPGAMCAYPYALLGPGDDSKKGQLCQSSRKECVLHADWERTLLDEAMQRQRAAQYEVTMLKSLMDEEMSVQ